MCFSLHYKPPGLPIEQGTIKRKQKRKGTKEMNERNERKERKKEMNEINERKVFTRISRCGSFNYSIQILK